MGNNNKGSIILLTIISVATLLVAVVGATFAYFNISSTSDKQTTIEVTSGTISIEYGDNSHVSAGALNPGDVLATKTFNVTGIVTGSSNLNYEVDLNVATNSYLDGELVYTLTSNNVSNNGTVISSTSQAVSIPTGATKVLLGNATFSGPVTAGAQHSYTLTVSVAGGAVSDPAKLFDGTISVIQSTTK